MGLYEREGRGGGYLIHITGGGDDLSKNFIRLNIRLSPLMGLYGATKPALKGPQDSKI